MDGSTKEERVAEQEAYFKKHVRKRKGTWSTVEDVGYNVLRLENEEVICYGQGYYNVGNALSCKWK